MARLGVFTASPTGISADPDAPLPVSVAAGSGTQPVSLAAGAVAAGAMVAGSQVDGHSASIGLKADAEAAADGSVIAILKRLRTLLSAGLPAALGTILGLKVEQVYGTPVVNGATSAAAPAAGTVVADTGALGAGNYRVQGQAGGAGVLTAGVSIECQHRNAANNATVSVLGACPLGATANIDESKIVIAASERIRWITVGTPGASSIYSARISALPTT